MRPDAEENDDKAGESPEEWPELSAGLSTLFRHAPIEVSEVPASVDQEMRLAIRAHYDQFFRRRRFVSWRLAPWAGAAAAVAAGLTAWIVSQRHSPAPQPQARQQLSGDVDGNGLVDILDAYALARRLQNSQPLELTLDLTGDGAIDRMDVDAIAMEAVALAPQGASS
ncbi:MAG: dockerin type I domain-containing protein [Phycisphaerales bacterium]|nr:dockerin type I domain-containing protein [Phycisphaerales bacterium]MCI0631926.1 dockerin type I domain-containing protein [Phycisphaerales bacterium]MCI0676202.1 dockerin type I domain-containing protein [Phycisphaerales bacterium]